jgi:hypothetical protein
METQPTKPTKKTVSRDDVLAVTVTMTEHKPDLEGKPVQEGIEIIRLKTGVALTYGAARAVYKALGIQTYKESLSTRKREDAGELLRRLDHVERYLTQYTAYTPLWAKEDPQLEFEDPR